MTVAPLVDADPVVPLTLLSIIDLAGSLGPARIEIAGRSASLPLTEEEITDAFADEQTWSVVVSGDAGPEPVFFAADNQIAWRSEVPQASEVAAEVLTLLGRPPVRIGSVPSHGLADAGTGRDSGTALLGAVSQDELAGLETLTGMLFELRDGDGLTESEQDMILLLARLIEDQRRLAEAGNTPRWGLVGVVRAAIQFSMDKLPASIVLWSNAASILNRIEWHELAQLIRSVGR